MDRMVNPLVQQEDDDIESLGMDIEEDAVKQEDDFENLGLDIEEDATAIEKGEPGFWGKVGDFFVQSGRGALKAFTWPADIIKLGMIGEGLNDLDELEEAHERVGKPFDRQKYIQDVFETAQYIPTQELAEKGFEDITGISLEPKSEAGKIAKQGAALAAFTPGGIAKKLSSAALGVGTTEALKGFGVGEGKAELIGDATSALPQLAKKVPKNLGKTGAEFEKTAQKHALPFLEFMAKEKAPRVNGTIFKSAEKRIKEQMGISTKQALDKVVKGQLPIKNLQDRGINLNAFSEHAYDVTEKLAKNVRQSYNTSKITSNIDKEISRIKSGAPSPSEAERAAIKILEQERDILNVSSPTAEQVVKQHRNYNANVKNIYRKPEFSGNEEEVRKAYAFLNKELLDMTHTSDPAFTNAFKAANKIFHEKSKLAQTESILGKAFDGSSYSPKKLNKILNSKQGNFLKRNLSKQAIEDIEEIAKYGKAAEERMNSFINIQNPSVYNSIASWGQLAPFILIPQKLIGGILSFAKPLGKHIQGQLLTRPATREIYKTSLKHAAEGSFQLLKKDFSNLDKEISKEWGTVDNFIDDMMEELEIYEGEEF